MDLLARIQPETRTLVYQDLLQEYQEEAGDKQWRVFFRGEKVVGISNPELTPVGNGIVVDAVRDSFPDGELDDAQVYHSEVTESGAFAVLGTESLDAVPDRD